MLSTSVLSSSGGMIRRTTFSISANCRAFSSTRVPTWRAHMHQDPPAVDERKEVASEIWRQRERADHEGQEAADKDRPMAQRHRQKLAIGEAGALETHFKAALQAHQGISRPRQRAVQAVQVGMRLMLAQHVLRHRRHQRARQDERPDHCRHHSFGQRHEQEVRHAGQKEHRHEDDANAQQRNEGGRHDLLGAVKDGLLDLLALLEMPVDVLDRHRRFVDENTDGQRQPAQAS